MPIKTKTAPKAKTGAGTSWKTATPRTVAPTGSRRAIVAVSNGLRPRKDEKYKVCAMAVGRRPSPIRGKILVGIGCKSEAAFPVATLIIPTAHMANP